MTSDSHALLTKKYRVGAITTATADYWIFYPLLQALRAHPEIDLVLYVLGMHVSDAHGMTANHIDASFRIRQGKHTLRFGDSPLGVSRAMGATTSEMAELLAAEAPDFMLCLGDRFEMFAAVSACVPLNIPVGHIHGGELSEGAFDEKFRHALTKLSDLHFASCEEYRGRILRMGANPLNVFNVGSLAAEAITKAKLITLEEVQSRFKIDFRKPTVLCTFHPETANPDKAGEAIGEFVKYLARSSYDFAITMSNADPASQTFRREFERIASDFPSRIHLLEPVNSSLYYSLMHHCRFMVGNSSSGIIEAASLNVPVINVGNRQKGRAISENTIHSPLQYDAILALEASAEKLRGRKFTNIYQQPNTKELIVNAILNYRQGPCYKFFDN